MTVPTIAATAERRHTIAVASLTRLSPSRIVTIRRGIPTLFAIAVAATASGGATTAPSASAAGNEIGKDPVGDEAGAEHRERHEPDRQQRDRPGVGPEVDQRGPDRGGVEQRWEDPDEYHVGVDVHIVHTGRHDATTPAMTSNSGAVRPMPAGQRRHGDHRGDQQDQLAGDLHGRPSWRRDGTEV